MPQPPPAARRPARSLDGDGFAALFVENYPLAVRYAARFTHDRTRAENVAAEAFLRGWRNRHRLRAVDEARAWLLSITHNCAISQLRRDRREIVDSERVRARATLRADDPGPAVDAPARTALYRAVARLSPDHAGYWNCASSMAGRRRGSPRCWAATRGRCDRCNIAPCNGCARSFSPLIPEGGENPYGISRRGR